MLNSSDEYIKRAEQRGWRNFFLSKGVFGQGVLCDLLEYAGRLECNGLPVIYDLRHLCLLTGRNEDYMSSVLNAPECHWREFSIPKRRGGMRQITVPYPALMGVQLWIYRNILQRVRVSSYCHGFVRGRSILTNVKWHVGQRVVLKIDLKDFFPSICVTRVASLFKSLGYNKVVSVVLAKLCTFNGSLPQGAPTSPALSNLIAQALDYRLVRYARKCGLHYTRYADDLTFSGDDISEKMVETILTIVRDTNFEVNGDKTKLLKNSGERIITGISVGKGIAMPRKAKRRLRQELHYVMTYGLLDHIQHERIRRRRYLRSLIGRVNFWLMIEPDCDYAITARNHLLSLYHQGFEEV